jgi:hypothetical protein
MRFVSGVTGWLAWGSSECGAADGVGCQLPISTGVAPPPCLGCVAATAVLAVLTTSHAVEFVRDCGHEDAAGRCSVFVWSCGGTYVFLTAVCVHAQLYMEYNAA